MRKLDRAALDLLRTTRNADPACSHCLDQLTQEFQQLNAVLGIKGNTPSPVPGRGQNLIDDCRALAIHLRATAWDAIGLERIVREGPHLHAPPAYRGGLELDRSCAQKALGAYQKAPWFETALWCLLQLHPIDRIVLGPLAAELGKAVAVTNSDVFDKLWQKVNTNLTGPHPPKPPAAGTGPLRPRL